LVNYKKLAFEANMRIINETAAIIKSNT